MADDAEDPAWLEPSGWLGDLVIEAAGRLMILPLGPLLAVADSLGKFEDIGTVGKIGVPDSTIGSAVGATDADPEGAEIDVGTALTLTGLVLIVDVLCDDAAGPGVVAAPAEELPSSSLSDSSSSLRDSLRSRLRSRLRRCDRMLYSVCSSMFIQSLTDMNTLQYGECLHVLYLPASKLGYPHFSQERVQTRIAAPTCHNAIVWCQ
jgi:hypothetical protein